MGNMCATINTKKTDIITINNKNDNKTKEKHHISKELYDYSKQNDILIIPLVKEYNLDNLYPVEDEVEKWNIFIVGQDRTYIQAKVTDSIFEINEDKILNTRGNKESISLRFKEFLNKIWNQTLKGKQLQFFTYINSKLFLLNSYPFRNNKNVIIGGICFIREAGIIDKKIFDLDVIFDNTEEKEEN
jgi:hypothetical protein